MRTLLEDRVPGPDGCVDAVLDAIEKEGGRIVGLKVEVQEGEHFDQLTQTDAGGVVHEAELRSHGDPV